MSVLELDLSALFVLAVILIWFMIAYQFVLTVFGYINYLRSLTQRRRADAQEIDYPTCTIMIPAHNEEKVIGRTVESLLRLEYPPSKMQILVINDGSTDATREIVGGLAAADSRVEVFDVPRGQGGKGKSRALNLGLGRATGEVIAVYDADNTPHKDALRYLVACLLSNKELGAVIGKFRTVNKNASLLTRFINIETLSFQSMLQAGRWQMHNIATLPGTNYVMWTRLIRKLHGWDEQALTEDSELSIRIYQEGFKVQFIPYAVTYEQEPEEWRVWIKQRMRWVRGNNYVIGKFLKQIPRFRSKRLALDLLYTLSLYYIFFVAIIISDLLFVAGALNLISIPLPGPYTFVWVMAFILFVFEILLAVSYDEEDSVRNIWIIGLMYFTYCQLWMYIVLRVIYARYVGREAETWHKTERYEVENPVNS